MTQAARQWEESGREPSELYRGARLSATLDWSGAHGTDLNELEREFVQQSRQAGEAETRKVRRTNRRLRGLLAGAAIFLIVALIAGSVAFVQRGHAQRSADAAERSADSATQTALVALAESLGSQGVSSPRLDTGLLLAVQGVQLHESLKTRGDLLATLQRGPTAIGLYRVEGEPVAMAVSPDGRTLAVTNSDAELRFYDLATRRQIGDAVTELTNNFGSGTISFTPDGSGLLLQRGPGPGQILDVGSREVVIALEGEPGTAGLTLSPDGRIAYDQGLNRWDARTGRRVPSTPQGNFIALPAIAAQTGLVVTIRGEFSDSSDPFPIGRGWVEVRNGKTLALERSIPIRPVIGNALYSIGVSADGDAAVINSDAPGDDRVRFIDLRTGRVTVGRGAVGGVSALMSPDGTKAITDSGTDTKTWDVAAAEVTDTLTGEGSVLQTMALDRTGHTLFVASNDGSITAYDLVGDRGFGKWFSAGTGNSPYPWNNGGIANVSVSPDGALVAMTQEKGIVNIVEIATGRVLSSFKAVQGEFVNYAEFSPDGKSLVTAGDPGDFAMWRLGASEPTLIRRFEGIPDGSTFMIGDFRGVFISTPWASFSPDGAWIAAFNSTATKLSNQGDAQSWQDSFVEWNSATGQLRGPLLDLTEYGLTNSGCWPDGCNITYSPDGVFMAIPAGPKVLIIDAATVKIVQELNADAQGVVRAMFSHNGRYLATAGFGGVLGLWDVRTWKEIRRIDASLINLHSVQFSEADDLLLVTGSAGATRLWSVPDLRQMGDTLPRNGPHGGWSISAYSGPWILLAYAEGHVFRYPATVAGWQEVACQIAGRNFTEAEWKLYVGSDRPYQKTCPGFP
jgi:WD40 repeat protein